MALAEIVLVDASVQRDRPDITRSSRGFTRFELVVVLATLASLAAVTRPIWGNGAPPRSLVCMDNLRRLTAAWSLYAEDSAGKFPGNYHGGFVPGATANQRPWATGWLDWSSSPDNTNTLYLTEGRYAAIGHLLGPDVTGFKCPSDYYLAVLQVSRGWTERVRSYAMNCYVGEGNQETGPFDRSYPVAKRRSDFRSLTPQQTFVFTEEHPDSVNDPLLFVNMSQWVWTDLPGSFHDGAGWFSFADGHVEPRTWGRRTTTRQVIYQPANQSPAIQNDQDLLWLRARTTAR